MISRGFAAAIEQSGYIIHACAILPDHVHLVVARHGQNVDRMIGHFKGAATLQLKDHGLHPMRDRPNRDGSPPSPWTRKGWKIFLDSAEGMGHAIRYVEGNPVKEGKPPQRWSFVTQYRGESGG